MTESINTLVIGAGVIGLAVARALAQSGREVIVIDKNGAIGEETSSRNSEVIHAGLYYPTGSLKARLCVEGKTALYTYCRDKHVPHDRIGKLIVAKAQQRERLEAIARKAAENGVSDLEYLDAGALARFEPAVDADAALLSPSTGIVDSHALMVALRADLEDAGGHVVLRTAFERATGGSLALESHGERTRIAAREVVNCAGLHAVAVARSLGCERALPEPRLAKGSYFRYQGPCPFARLIYPLPVVGGLGIHATLDLAGHLRFGPDVEWIDEIDYSVEATRAAAFADAVRTYWPGIDPERLEPAYAGIRPKLFRADEMLVDFEVICERRAQSTMLHLLGFESPGLTACLAIAALVRERLDSEWKH